MNIARKFTKSRACYFGQKIKTKPRIGLRIECIVPLGAAK
jgi:hypothetical protein